MTKSEIQKLPEYFDRYINLVENIDLFDAFSKSIQALQALDLAKIGAIGLTTYLPGKWTVNEIFQHIADIERILVAGTLRFARGEENYVISFDEEEIAKKSKANNKDICQIIGELITVRHSTIALFKSFDKDDFQKSGINWKHRISIEAMAFNIIGHQIHHLNIIEQMYFPLVD